MVPTRSSPIEPVRPAVDEPATGVIRCGAEMAVMRILRAPAVHFLVVGGLLFCANQWSATSGTETVPAIPPAPVVISAVRLAAVRESHASSAGRSLTKQEEGAMIERLVEEELLYREACARGFDRSDRSVRFRLVEIMKFLGEDPGAAPEDLYREALRLGLDRDDIVLRRMLVEKMRLVASSAEAEPQPHDSDLQAYLLRHAARYLQPARVTLSHVFLRGAGLGDPHAGALRLRADLLRDSVTTDDAVSRGDVFPLGHHFVSSSEQNLAKIFGSEFATAVMQVEAGSWSAPIPSAFGLHLVFVSEKWPAGVPPLSAVRSRVARALQAERRAERYRKFVAELKQRYEVRVD